MINWIVDKLHVSTTDEEIKADFRKRCARARKAGSTVTEEQERETIAAALKRHHENQKMYREVMG